MTGVAVVEGEVGPGSGGSSRPHRLVSLITVALVAGALALLLAGSNAFVSERAAPWWVLLVVAVGFGVAESSAFHVEYRSGAISFTLSEVPVAYSLVFLGPVPAIAVRVVGSLVIYAFVVKLTPQKLAFNGALFMFETALAFAVIDLAWRATDPSDGAMLVAIAVATATATFVGSLVVSTVIACFEGRLVERFVGELRTSVVIGPVGATLAAVAVAPALFGLGFGLLSIMPIAGAWFVLVRHGRLTERHRHLNAVHGFTRHVGGSIRLAELLPVALDDAMRLLRAERGLIRMSDDAHGVTLPAYVATPGRPARPFVPDDEFDEIDRPSIDDMSSAGGDRLAVPIVDGAGELGTLVFAGRAGLTDRFGADDLALAQRLADQLAVSLRNSLLHEAAERAGLSDPLTGRANRTAFDRRVAEVAGDPAHVGTAAVLMLDLDRFKEVNDTLGHGAGDRVLIEVAERLDEMLRPGDLLARFGGDEFAIFAVRTDLVEMLALADEIVQRSHDPFVLDGFNVVVAGSVGLAPLQFGDGAEDVVRRADIAMYTAKQQHTGAELYSEEIDRRTPQRLSLLADLRAGLRDGQLDVHYQPKLDLANDTVVGVEALVRWNHPIRGSVPPDDFIRVAEEAGLIREITDFVLTRATGDLRRWRDSGLDLHVAVNLSTLDLVDTWLCDRVADRLAVHRLDPHLLTLEITESALMLDTPRAVTTIDRLKELGVGISLDDFGTGFSSLSYLRRLPVSELKIDRSFVSNLLLDIQDAAIVTSTIALGHSLGLRIVAEGVESPDVSARLASLDCDLIQGFGVSRPLAAPMLERWFDTTEHTIMSVSGADRSCLTEQADAAPVVTATSGSLHEPAPTD